MTLSNLLVLLLVTAFCMVTVSFAHDRKEYMMKSDPTTGMMNSSVDCESKCQYRCSKSSRWKICYRDCVACCRACDGCVPPGTAGNREVCPCYANLKNSKGTGKCP
ncbi:hypothetical protein KP509_04G080000 [Ceratopteris richardii]|uniref:Gibberellin regulated protein n=1 Tax=Ceratopteris richardii TaxID=49495 RepID=A0A8T2UYL5_CERRI|nr:hypothetical protein KP509_04G080000 [Ceratopteris richardii]